MRATARKVVALVPVGALTLTSLAFAAKTGEYSGTTGQKVAGKPATISLNVAANKVRTVKVTAVVNKGGGSCAGTGGLIFTFNKPHVAIDKHNKFHKSFKSSDGSTTLKINGTFKGKKVSGSFTAGTTFGGIHPQTCSSGKVKFTAKTG